MIYISLEGVIPDFVVHPNSTEKEGIGVSKEDYKEEETKRSSCFYGLFHKVSVELVNIAHIVLNFDLFHSKCYNNHHC